MPIIANGWYIQAIKLEKEKRINMRSTYFVNHNGESYKIDICYYGNDYCELYAQGDWSYKYHKLKMYYKHPKSWRDYFSDRYGYYVNLPVGKSKIKLYFH